MIFFGLGYLMRKTGASQALMKGAVKAGAATVKGAVAAGKHVALPAAKGVIAKGAPYVKDAAMTAAADTLRAGAAAGKAALGTGKVGLRALFDDAPQGRSIDNLFTGKRLRPAAVATGEAAALYWALGQAPERFVAARSAPDALPMLTRSGNVDPTIANYQHDPLLGARGGLAFALHRLRHG